MRYNRSPRRGVVAVLVALSLIMLVGFAAVAVDGGLLLHREREVQSVADAAALAAADDLFLNYRLNQGVDKTGTAAKAAVRVAADNGFDKSNSTVTVNIPPLTGLFVGQPGYAEVIITYNQPRGFSGIFGTESIPVAARAVAYGSWTPAKIGILVLDPHSSGSFYDNGGGTVNVSGVPIIVDSDSPTAMVAVGGATVTASEFDVTGVPGQSGSGVFTGTLYNGVPPTPDPLRYLPEPDPSTMTQQVTKNSGLHVSGGNKTIQPGVYSGGISVTGNGSLNMQPGIYYMDGGGFSFSGQGNLDAQGVMIVNNPSTNSDVISISGSPGASIVLTPMTTGPYQGISLWQTRTSTNTISVSGNGSSTISGTFYAQHGLLQVSGNGGSDVLGAQYISYDLKISGNGGYKLNWNADQVARLRKLYLVE
jgi:hypothetical protein